MEELENEDATVLPLHSEIDWEEQKKCFEKYSNSKVIVSTNIAQTSVTPDIDVVIDTGKAKISIAENGVQGLYEVDISVSDIMQRKGRAGRTKNGRYILCSNMGIEGRREYILPEMQRSILDRTVLQLAVVGIDAEKLEFYHQPDKQAIKAAKEELEILGALSGTKVTELGHKMVKIPVAVQYSRMIIEAEKYGVTNQVITIAAILENGGLLSKEGSYSTFTSENKSDLLAELDVWNYITSNRVDFKKFGINKKNYFKIRDSICKIKESLSKIVDIRAKNDRDAILKSCISGLISHVFEISGWYDNKCISRDGDDFLVERSSCINYGIASDYIVGKPISFETKGRYGEKRIVNVVRFATRIDEETILANIPSEYIEKVEHTSYSRSHDAVEVTTNMSFGYVDLGSTTKYVTDHPKYEELKAEDERWREKYRESYSAPIIQAKEYITIGDKEFEVKDDWTGKRFVCLDKETVFTTDVKEAVLKSGEKVWFRVLDEYTRSAMRQNILELRNALENKYISEKREEKLIQIKNFPSDTIQDILLNSTELGKVLLTKDRGGYGEIPIYVYVCLRLNKNTVAFYIDDNENEANLSTKEALQNLFIKYVQKNYGNSKFSNTNSKQSNKPLNDNERRVKSDFDDFVREILTDLDAENIKDSIEFVEEYYTDLMK